MTPDLIVAPVLLPVLTAALMLVLGEKRRRLKAVINVGSTALGLVIALVLLRWVDQAQGPAEAAALGIALPGNWAAPYGIVLALDRLSAAMLVLTGGVALAALLFAIARWDRAGVHFHPLFQVQLMGLYGAFLTADLFNLFVFFEVMLAASYGLLLHGSGRARVSAGLHYVAINLAASSLFLIGVAVLYGVTGTLNLADLAQKIPQVVDGDRGLLQAGSAILATAFLIKAAAWPLNFWLAPGYTAASAPVAALFAVMTKLGVYVLLRLSTLMFSDEAGASAQFGADWLAAIGLATLAYGAIGMLASQKLERLASYAIVVSSGTLLAAVGLGGEALVGAALFYLLASTLAASALFLLAELIERSRMTSGPALADDESEHFPMHHHDDGRHESSGLNDGEEALIGKPIPAAMAFLGLSFITCVLLVAGMPPLAGFVGKFALLSTLLQTAPNAAGGLPAVGLQGWGFMVLVILSGLLSLMALSRAGVRHFWAPQDRPPPRLRLIECVPIAGLLAACVLLTVEAGPVMRYLQATAVTLHDPAIYVDAVLGARPLPSPTAGGGL